MTPFLPHSPPSPSHPHPPTSTSPAWPQQFHPRPSRLIFLHHHCYSDSDAAKMKKKQKHNVNTGRLPTCRQRPPLRTVPLSPRRQAYLQGKNNITLHPIILDYVITSVSFFALGPTSLRQLVTTSTHLHVNPSPNTLHPHNDYSTLSQF